MISFISDNRLRAIALRKIMLKKHIFAYHSGFPDLENAHGIKDHLKALPKVPAIAIIDGTSSLTFAESCCAELKKLYSDAVCVAIVSKELSPFVRYKYLASSDIEIEYQPTEHMANELERILRELGYSVPLSFSHLKLGHCRRESTLLNMKLWLTEAEYNILVFLCGKTSEYTDEETILFHCFAESYRMVTSNVRAHISSINKKAYEICGRRLVLCQREKGYYLNPYM